MPSTCNKIVKKSLYEKLNIKYIEDKYEDLSTNPFVLFEAKTLKYFPKGYYEYYIRENSIMRSSAGYSMIDIIKIVNDRLNKYKESISVEEEKFKYYTFSCFSAFTSDAQAASMININGNAAAMEIVCNGFNPPAINNPTANTD